MNLKLQILADPAKKKAYNEKLNYPVMLAADSGKEAKEPIDEEEPSGPEKRSPGAPIHWEPTQTKLWFLTTVELN